jgi:hypothetical protein
MTPACGDISHACTTNEPRLNGDSGINNSVIFKRKKGFLQLCWRVTIASRIWFSSGSNGLGARVLGIAVTWLLGQCSWENVNYTGLF